MAVTITDINDPTGGALPWQAAQISQDSVLNTEQVFYFLRPTAPGLAPGAIQADYAVNPANGALTVADTVFYQPNGGIVATYYGNEALNPLLNSIPASTGFTAGNPGYAYTQYIYSSPGVLSQVVAHEANGQTFVGTGAAIT